MRTRVPGPPGHPLGRGSTMDVDDLILVSVDDHVVEPPNVFEGRLPAKYADAAPQFVTRADGTSAWRYEGAEMRQHRPQRGGGAAARGVRHGAHLVRRDPPGLLRHPRAGRGHGRQRRPRVAVLPLLPAVLRAAVRPDQGQGRGAGHGAGLQRLAHRRVVRHLPRPVHPAAPSRPSGIPRCWPPRSGARRPRAATPSPSRRIPSKLGWPSIHTRPLGPVLDGLRATRT